MKKGVITKLISNQYTVLVDGEKIVCTARGIFKYNKISPVVGDYVMVNIEDKIIDDILERKNKLNRPVVANVDVALIMMSVKTPDLSLNLLDKLLSVIKVNNIEPIICFSKIDLLNKKELIKIEELKKSYESIGYKVFFNTELNKIKNYLYHKVVVITGQTGAGKSTFLNKLAPNLNLETKPISKALNRGVHTTRHVEIYEIDNIYFVDTPGFSALNLETITVEELKKSFIEFSDYQCRFNDCNHEHEIKCGVKHAVEENKIMVSRYNNYLLFKKEIYENSSKLYK